MFCVRRRSSSCELEGSISWVCLACVAVNSNGVLQANGFSAAIEDGFSFAEVHR